MGNGAFHLTGFHIRQRFHHLTFRHGGINEHQIVSLREIAERGNAVITVRRFTFYHNLLDFESPEEKQKTQHRYHGRCRSRVEKQAPLTVDAAYFPMYRTRGNAAFCFTRLDHLCVLLFPIGAAVSDRQFRDGGTCVPGLTFLFGGALTHHRFHRASAHLAPRGTFPCRRRPRS